VNLSCATDVLSIYPHQEAKCGLNPAIRTPIKHADYQKCSSVHWTGSHWLYSISPTRKGTDDWPSSRGVHCCTKHLIGLASSSHRQICVHVHLPTPVPAPTTSALRSTRRLNSSARKADSIRLYISCISLRTISVNTTNDPNSPQSSFRAPSA
jgi:hypothetical protein